MTSPSLPEEAIFLAALDKSTRQERAAYVEAACAGNVALRSRVLELLGSHDASRGPLDAPPTGLGATLDAVPERPGTQIGPYKLLQQIGEGGMGVVYMAEQTEPIARRVALKIIKPGMDSRQVIARFEAERQALAVMDHPNIAKVLDAGEVGQASSLPGNTVGQASRLAAQGQAGSLPHSGRPYFVMELVHGTPITQYCDENSLPVRERLELFATVCHAIQHAHTKGIIHRDIKPTNVLVAEYDDQAVAKIIDFGVAKAVGPRLTEKSMFTEFGQLVGTLEYMSPEQARLNQLDIDTRSDIYSLGVLLYELLTGTTPFDQSRLRTLAFDETLRIIREVEPLKPSTRLRSSDTLPSVAANRNTEPVRLSRAVRGELDWIVMKALDKDRDRRYGTAIGLALDIERHLRDDPVLACAPSAWYRLRKLARRNKAIFVGATAAVLVTLLGVAALITSNILIRQEQARTKQEKVRAEKAQKLAEGRAEEVRQGLERLKAANALLDRGRWYALERGWDDAHEAFSQAIQLHPDHVSVWVERGDLHTRLGLWDLAAADYARESDLREPDTTLRWYQHALLRRAIGDEEGCRQISREMRERFAGTTKKSFAEETLRSNLLAPDPAADHSQLIELAREVACNQPLARFVLGAALYRAGQYDESVQQLQEALKAQPEWAIKQLSHPVLAMAHHRLGHTTEARQALDEAARILDRWTQERYARQGELPVLQPGGDAHWPVPWWDYLECQLLYGEAKLLIDGDAPPDDPRLHVLRARALAGLNWVEQAASEFDAALNLSPQDSQIRLEAHRNRGGCCVHRRQWRQAAAEFAKAVVLRPADPYLWRFQAVAQFADGDVEGHRETCMAMLERFGQTEEHGTAANLLLACVLRDESIPDVERLLPLTRVSDPMFHWGAGVHGAALYRAGRYEECVQCFETSATKYRPRPWDWCFLTMAQHRLGRSKEARRCLAEAQRWIDAANHHTEDDLSGTQPVWGGWHEPVVSTLLLAEAEELLKKETGTRNQESGVRQSRETKLTLEP